MPRVLNLGSLNLDHVYGVPHFVRPGETLSSGSYAIFAGGKGFNQSIALARAGARVAHAGAIGPDGRWLRERLAAESVEVEKLVEVDLATGHAIIQVAPTGENAIVLHAGANHALEAAAVAGLCADARPGDHALTQNETSGVPEFLHAARAAGLVVWLNPAPLGPEVAAYPLACVDWLVVNETEAEALTGARHPHEIAERVRRRWPHLRLLLTLGAEGACFAHGGEFHHEPAAPVAEVVDTTAAGDTFVGFFIAAVLEGRAIPEALARACRAAALCVGRRGAADSIPRLREL